MTIEDLAARVAALENSRLSAFKDDLDVLGEAMVARFLACQALGLLAGLDRPAFDNLLRVQRLQLQQYRQAGGPTETMQQIVNVMEHAGEMKIPRGPISPREAR